jgi:hypothetical protein
MSCPILKLLAGLASLLMCSACRDNLPSSKEPIFTKEMLLSDEGDVCVNESFRILASEKYKLAVILYQKNAVQGSSMQIAGNIKILDSNGAILGDKMITEIIVANQTRLDLWIFDAKEVGGVGQKRLEIRMLSEDTQLQKQYTKMVVYITPERKRWFWD